MLGEHCVSDKVGDVVEMPEEILCIIEEILADNLAVLMCEDLAKEMLECGFFFLSPVTQRIGNCHERQAHGFRLRPCDADAGDVSCAGFNVASEFERGLADAIEDLG